jgi:EmrB/QacA subfamily drug resistance transporter
MQTRSVSEQTTKQPEDFQFSGRTIAFTLMGTMLITFIATLDQTVVGTALPRIVADLQGFEQIAWITTIYLLTSTVTIPIYGKLSDLLGRKAIFLAAITIFLIGSALCGAAQSMTQLVIFRALQGIGAGGLQPIASAVVADLFPPRQRGRWVGVTSSSYALAAIVGPLLGGLLTDAVSWRWVFYINLPLGLIAVGVLIFVMPTLRTPNKRVIIDYLGVLLIVLATLPLLLGFTWAGDRTIDWLSWQSLGLFGAALVLLVVLVVYSAWQERLGRGPIVEPSMFTNVRIFSVSLVAAMLISVVLIGAVYFLPVFMQSVVGVSATNSGLTLIPFALFSIAGAVIGGQITSATGRYKLQALAGAVLMIVGVLLLLRLDIHSSVFDVLLALIPLGIGVGSSLALSIVVIQNAMPQQKIGQATAVALFFRQIGQSLGLAAIGSVVISAYVPAFHNALPSGLKQALPAQIIKVSENPLVLLSPDAMVKIRAGFEHYGAQGHAAFQAVLDAVKVGLTGSIHQGFVVCLILMVLTLVLLLFLKEVPLRSEQHADIQEEGGSAVV